MQKKSHIKQRILEYLDKKSITRYSFYKESGITRGVLEQSSGLSEENLGKFLAFAQDISLNWLLYGAGPMLRRQGISPHFGQEGEPYSSEREVGSVSRARDLHAGYQTGEKGCGEGIPLYELKPGHTLSGLFLGTEGDFPVGRLTVPGLPVCDGALCVRGENHGSLLKSGDIVIYKVLQEHETLMYGEIYLLSIDMDGEEFVTIRYIREGGLPGWVRLEGCTPHVDAQEISRTRIRALALVKATVRFNTMR